MLKEVLLMGNDWYDTNFGEEIENGELPNDIAPVGKIIEDICYHNANKYFKF